MVSEYRHVSYVFSVLQKSVACQFLHSRSPDDVVVVDAEWSASGNVGDGADESVLDELCQSLWLWWRTQVQKFWMSRVPCTVLSLLWLASNTTWLAAVTKSSLGEASTQEEDWTWVVSLRCYHSWSCRGRYFMAFLKTLTLDHWIFRIHPLIWLRFVIAVLLLDYQWNYCAVRLVSTGMGDCVPVGIPPLESGDPKWGRPMHVGVG